MQNRIAQQHQRIERITLNHQFHCARISGHARRRPDPSRTRAYFSLHPKLRLPDKTQCFVQILTFKWDPWCTKTQLSRDVSVRFYELKLWKQRFRAMLPSHLYSTLLFCTLRSSPLLSSTVLFSSHDYVQQMPTGHNNLLSYVLSWLCLSCVLAGANWTQWSFELCSLSVTRSFSLQNFLWQYALLRIKEERYFEPKGQEFTN